jgi:hypothetical protein
MPGVDDGYTMSVIAGLKAKNDDTDELTEQSVTFLRKLCTYRTVGDKEYGKLLGSVRKSQDKNTFKQAGIDLEMLLRESTLKGDEVAVKRSILGVLYLAALPYLYGNELHEAVEYLSCYPPLRQNKYRIDKATREYYMHVLKGILEDNAKDKTADGQERMWKSRDEGAHDAANAAWAAETKRQDDATDARNKAAMEAEEEEEEDEEAVSVRLKNIVDANKAYAREVDKRLKDKQEEQEKAEQNVRDAMKE